MERYSLRRLHSGGCGVGGGMGGGGSYTSRWRKAMAGAGAAPPAVRAGVGKSGRRSRRCALGPRALPHPPCPRSISRLIAQSVLGHPLQARSKRPALGGAAARAHSCTGTWSPLC